MKVIFTGDFHLSSAQVRTRLDKSPETGLNKLEQVFQLARKHQAVLIFPGDFLHNNSNSTEYLLQIISVINKYSDVQAFCIKGNHECRGDDPTTYSISQMQLIYGATHLRYLTSQNIGGVYFRGYQAYEPLDVSEPDKVQVLVCHHWLEDAYNDKLVCKPSEVKKIFPNLKYILTGHDHAEYPPATCEGVICLRPGSVMRIDSSQHRQPQVTLFDTESPEEIYALPLEAPDWQKLFMLETKEVKKEIDARIDRFIGSMTRPTTSVDVVGIIKEKLSTIVDPGLVTFIKQDLATVGYSL